MLSRKTVADQAAMTSSCSRFVDLTDAQSGGWPVKMSVLAEGSWRRARFRNRCARTSGRGSCPRRCQRRHPHAQPDRPRQVQPRDSFGECDRKSRRTTARPLSSIAHRLNAMEAISRLAAMPVA
jgi:hypothetical protein